MNAQNEVHCKEVAINKSFVPRMSMSFFALELRHNCCLTEAILTSKKTISNRRLKGERPELFFQGVLGSLKGKAGQSKPLLKK